MPPVTTKAGTVGNENPPGEALRNLPNEREVDKKAFGGLLGHETSEKKKNQFGTIDLVMKFLPFSEWLKFSEDVLSLKPTLIKKYQEKFEKCVTDLKEEMRQEMCEEPDQLLAMYYSKQETKLQGNENRTKITESIQSLLSNISGKHLYIHEYFKNSFVQDNLRRETAETDEDSQPDNDDSRSDISITNRMDSGDNIAQSISQVPSDGKEIMVDLDKDIGTNQDDEEQLSVSETTEGEDIDLKHTAASEARLEHPGEENTEEVDVEQAKVRQEAVGSISNNFKSENQKDQDAEVHRGEDVVKSEQDIRLKLSNKDEELKSNHFTRKVSVLANTNKKFDFESNKISTGEKKGLILGSNEAEVVSCENEKHGRPSDNDEPHNKVKDMWVGDNEKDIGTEPIKQDSGTQTNYDSEEALEVQKEITCKGGELEIDECKVSIPENAVDEPIMVTISLNFDVSKWPEGQTAVSPMMCCLSSGTTTFKRPIKMELSTWLCSGAKSEVSIMNYSKKRDPKWQEITKAFPNEEGKIVFEVDHFCKNVAAIAKDNFDIEFLIYAFLFHKDDKHFVSVFCRKSKSLKRKLESEFSDYQKSLPAINEIKVQRGDKIFVHLKAKNLLESGENLQFDESEQSVEVDELLYKEKFVRYFTPTGKVEQQKIMLMYTIRLNDGDCESYNVPVHWRLSKQNAQSRDTLIYKPLVHRDLHSGGTDYSVEMKEHGPD